MRRITIALFLIFLAVGSFAADQSARESAYLSDSTYKNPFYDLGMTLPSANTTTRRALGPQGQGVHALLAVRFERPTDDGALTVFATDATSGLPLDPKEAAKAQVKECEKQGMSFRRGPSELINTDKTHQRVPLYTHAWVIEEFNTPTGEFMVYMFFQKKGELITVVSAAKSRKSAGTNLEPWWPMPEYFDLKGQKVDINYEGPAPRTGNTADLSQAKPSGSLPNDGRLNGKLWSSASLGMKYGIPQGWNVADAQDPWTKYHPAPSDAAAKASHELLKACSQAALQAAEPAADGATLSLLVAEPECMHLGVPDMNNIDQVQALATSLAQFSDFGQVSGAGILTDAGTSFIELKGVLADGRQQVVFVTPRGKFLVLMFFTAKNASQIDILPNTGLSFDSEKK